MRAIDIACAPQRIPAMNPTQPQPNVSKAIPGIEAGVWNLMRQRGLYRCELGSSDMVELDRGVNFFILALEARGANTLFSCEGHPKGFYVVFAGSARIANEVKAAGVFDLNQAGGLGLWRMSLGDLEGKVKNWGSDHRDRCLDHAAKCWVHTGLAGPLARFAKRA